MSSDALGYIPGEAEGAYPNGSRIMKVEGEEGDSTPLGAGGEVISSLDARHLPPVKGRKADYFYFVAWDWLPAVPIGVVDWKIGLSTTASGS